MNWQITSLYSVGEQQLQLQFVLVSPTDDEMEIKNMFQKYKIVTLSMTPHVGEPKDFAPTTFQFMRDGKTYDIIMQTDSYKDTCAMLMTSGFDILNITSTTTYLPPEEAKKIIAEIKKKVMEEKQKTQEAEIQAKKMEEKKFGGDAKQKLTGIIDQTVEDIESLKGKVTNIATGNELKQLSDFQEELKKLKRGTNADKMTQLLEDAFILMDKLEAQHLAIIKGQEKPIVSGSMVTDVDVVREYEKYQRSIRIVQAGAAKSREDNYYILFGKAGIYLRFIKKEILDRGEKLTNILQGCMNFIEYTIVFLAINFGLYFLLQKLGQEELTDSIYKQLVHIGLIGGALSITKFLKFNNIVMTLLWIGASLIIYLVASGILSSTFSL